jgi:hypothetical protein
VSSKVDPQEVSALIPNGIEAFQPKCCVCGDDVPRRRATGRSKHTCKPACQQVMQLFKKHNVFTTRCKTCFHPSTPKEREDFKAWRRTRGELREGRGRPKRTEHEKLIDAEATNSADLQPAGEQPTPTEGEK